MGAGTSTRHIYHEVYYASDERLREARGGGAQGGAARHMHHKTHGDATVRTRGAWAWVLQGTLQHRAGGTDDMGYGSLDPRRVWMAVHAHSGT